MDFETEAINAHTDKLRQHFYYQQKRLDLIVDRLEIGLVYSKVNIVQSEFVEPGTYLHTTAVRGKRPIAISRLTLGDCPRHPMDDRAFVWGLVLELMRIKGGYYNLKKRREWHRKPTIFKLRAFLWLQTLDYTGWRKTAVIAHIYTQSTNVS